MKLCRPEPQNKREMKIEKKVITDVRHCRVGSCKPSIRGETSAEAERERKCY